MNNGNMIHNTNSDNILITHENNNINNMNTGASIGADTSNIVIDSSSSSSANDNRKNDTGSGQNSDLCFDTSGNTIHTHGNNIDANHSSEICSVDLDSKADAGSNAGIKKDSDNVMIDGYSSSSGSTTSSLNNINDSSSRNNHSNSSVVASLTEAESKELTINYNN